MSGCDGFVRTELSIISENRTNRMILRKTQNREKTLQNVDNSVDCVNYSHNKSDSIA